MIKHSHAIRVAAIAATVCLLVGGAIQSGAAAVAPTVPDVGARAQVQMAVPIDSIVAAQVEAANAVVARSRQVLSASAGHTLPDNTRAELGAAATAASGDIAGAAGDAGALGVLAARSGGGANTQVLAKRMVSVVHDLNALQTDLAALSAASAKVSASEAARSAQLKAAALRAAAGTYHEVVWTSGFQAQINACRGAVNLTGAYHVRVIGEEWQCGGARFPKQGALVQLTGVISGIYRVGPVVAVLDAYVAHTSNIPRGYPLLYQTCRGGNAHTETFTELIPVS